MRVVSTTTVVLSEPIPVYCFTAKETANFTLANGAIVHNCGGLRQVRQKHQALLPLRGKVLNAVRAKSDKVLMSRDILNILAAIGFDAKAEDPLRKLQIGRIIFLADADADGAHINCLLHALTSRYLPGLYEQGMVYVADMPEFYAVDKDRIFTGDSLSEVKAKLNKAGSKADILHAKGWGEVDAQILKILAIDPSRRLIQINPLTPKDKSTFFALMGRANDESE